MIRNEERKLVCETQKRFYTRSVLRNRKFLDSPHSGSIRFDSLFGDHVAGKRDGIANDEFGFGEYDIGGSTSRNNFVDTEGQFFEVRCPKDNVVN